MKKKSTVAIIVGIALFAILIVGTSTGSILQFRPTASSSSVIQQQQQQKQPTNSLLMQKLFTPSIATAPALGSNMAPVTLVEFGDYQCTFCHRFHSDTKNLILTNFVDTGKVRFLFKDFPINDLPADRASTLASEASYCAADQGKYWQYYDELYNNSKGENTGWVTKDALKQFASNLSIKDINQFSQCLESGKYAAVVADNFNLAQSIGLNATPSFILMADGKQPLEIVGAQPYSVFENLINQFLGS
jgi:protein-disulfide isomerase